MELNEFLNTIGLTVILIFGSVSALFAIGLTVRLLTEDKWHE